MNEYMYITCKHTRVSTRVGTNTHTGGIQTISAAVPLICVVNHPPGFTFRAKFAPVSRRISIHTQNRPICYRREAQRGLARVVGI